MTIAACMISCPEREAVRRESLASLIASDWQRTPVTLVLDQARYRSQRDRFLDTVWRALTWFTDSGADLLVYLEDDVAFNRHFKHNLVSWLAAFQGQLEFGTLYNPGFRDWAWDFRRHSILADPASFIGNQAIVMTQRFARHMLDRFGDGPDQMDLKFGAAATLLKLPVITHVPSLVQHLGQSSVLGSPFHRAVDFDAAWRTADETPCLRAEFVGGKQLDQVAS